MMTDSERFIQVAHIGDQEVLRQYNVVTNLQEILEDLQCEITGGNLDDLFGDPIAIHMTRLKREKFLKDRYIEMPLSLSLICGIA